MIKLIVLMALGKRIKHPNRIFYLVKSYMIFYMLAFPITNFAQSFEWINPYPIEYSYNTDLLNICVSVDGNDQVFWGGMFMFHEYYASASFGDLNIIKHNADGNVLFTFYAYGKGNIVNMIHDNTDNLILIIDIKEDLLLDSADTIFHTGDNVSSHIVKFDPDFNMLWTKLIADNISYSRPNGITVNTENNIYFAQNNFQHSNVIILNPEGEEIDSIQQENVAMISSIAIDDEGNLYTAGSCASQDATFGGVLYDHDLSYNFYIAKYNNQFEAQWVNYVEDITCQFPKVLVSDPDHVYFAGELYFNTIFGSIPVNGPDWVYDYFVAKLNTLGEFEWVAEVPEATVIAGDASIGKMENCSLDSENNLTLTGFIRGSIDWGNGMVTESTNVGYDLLVVKYNTEGEVIMEKHGGGESFDKAISSTLDSDGNLYIAGFGYDSTKFDDIETYYESYYPFLLKLNNENVSTGIQNNTISNLLRVYPNPVSEVVSIDTDKIYGELSIIQLVDINGSVLENMRAFGKSRIQIDLSQYGSGVYFLKIETIDNNYYQQKILKL